MEDIGAVGKEKRNNHQGFNFRGIDDALNHCSPILSKHGVSVSVNVNNHKVDRWAEKAGTKERMVFHCTLSMLVTFWAPDGSHLSNTLAGEAMDYNGDKSTNKAMAAAMKYGLFFGLVIPVDESAIDDSDRDPKGEDREPQQQPQSQPQQSSGAQNTSRRDPVKDAKAVLKFIGCKTAADWDDVVKVVTGDEIKKATDLADPAKASLFLGLYSALNQTNDQVIATNILLHAREKYQGETKS